jgi:hypothetical protein
MFLLGRGGRLERLKLSFSKRSRHPLFANKNIYSYLREIGVVARHLLRAAVVLKARKDTKIFDPGMFAGPRAIPLLLRFEISRCFCEGGIFYP